MAAFDFAKVKDPTFFKENVLNAHASFRTYASREEYLAGESSLALKLDGIWKFAYAKNYTSAIPGFEKTDYDCSGWDDIHVPAHIQMEGYDIPQYANVQYPWDGREEVQPGVNKLAVQVFKWTSSSWCEDQDFFRFSGIFRSVWLYAIPTVHLEDVSVKTLFAGDDFTHSTLEVALQVEGKGAARLTLRRSELEVFSEKIALNGGSALFSHAVENPHLWSAEDPALYELEIELLDDADHLVEVTGQKVGFRKFELKNNRMLLNGKRIVFKGANRHEFSSITGRAVGVHTHEELLRDIITMKQNNINAIRTSHYQNQDALYDLCDEYGLYLIAENNLESHGTWDIHQAGIRGIEGVLPNDKPEWKAVLFDRMNSTCQRDKNHPAVLIWSLGNESFGGETLLQMAEMVRRFDDTRLVHYEGVVNDPRFLETTDIESHMYSTVKDIKEYLAQGDKRPYIECEYSHAMGNSNGALHKYTELADQKDCGYQGGFIWDYIDQSIWKKGRYEQLPITLTADHVAAALGISRANAYILLRSDGFPTLHIGVDVVLAKQTVQFFRNTQGINVMSSASQLAQQNKRTATYNHHLIAVVIVDHQVCVFARAVSFFCRSITLALLNFCVSSHLHCSVRLTQVELSADTANTTGGSGNRVARCVRL